MTTPDPDRVAPTDDAERLRDAEDALRAFYARVAEAERELANETARADAAERKVAIADEELADKEAALAEAERLRGSDADLRHRIGELDEQIARAHEEIQALHNSRTMRAVAFPRRVYAKIRALLP